MKQDLDKNRDINLLARLDMMENMEQNKELVDQQLFKICLLKCIQFENSFLFFDSIKRFFIEISNNYKTTLMETMPLL